MAYINSKHNKRRSKQSLSHEFKFTCNMSNLVPVLVDDVVPGDTISLKTDAVVRFAPMLAPLMHEVDVFTHYFFVPNRLIWNDWESFITGGERGEDDSVPPFVKSGIDGFAIGSLADYFGMPVGVADIDVSALPFRAYNLVVNEWYRQQDLQDPLVIDHGEGEDTGTNLSLYNRNWNKDYFTSCLPNQQKGPAVSLPLTGDAPVIGTAPIIGLGSGSTDYATTSSAFVHGPIVTGKQRDLSVD